MALLRIFSISILIVQSGCVQNQNRGTASNAKKATYKNMQPIDSNVPQNILNPPVPNSPYYPLASPNYPNAPTKLDNCLSNTNYNACLINKNANFQTNSLVDKSTDTSQLQTYGVNLTKLNGSGFLENANVAIYSSRLPRTLAKASGNWRYSGSENSGSSLKQLMAYFWANYAIQYWKEHVGFNYIDKQLKIYVDDSFSGFSKDRWSIHLQQADTTEAIEDHALNAEVLIQLLGQASLQAAIGLETTAQTTEQSCGINGRDNCCKTSAGCLGAIRFGVGEYYTAVVFAENPILGETLAESLSGHNVCGLQRSYDNLNTSFADAFTACAAELDGAVKAMGVAYAQSWWNMRKQVLLQNKDVRAFDYIFMLHLESITSTDNFPNAINRAREVANTKFPGIYDTVFLNELNRQGY